MTLKIAALQVPGLPGRLGICSCPGRDFEPYARNPREPDMAGDLAAIRAWGGTLLITLIDGWEFDELRVAALPAEAARAGLEWHHAPIHDNNAPGLQFENAWSVIRVRVHAVLSAGGGVVVHCAAGVGRSGLVAAKVLVEAGATPSAALTLVKKVRPGAFEVPAQRAYVLELGK